MDPTIALVPIRALPGSNFQVLVIALPGSETAQPWAAAPRLRWGSLDSNDSLLAPTCRTRFVAGRSAFDPKQPSRGQSAMAPGIC
jgi:hypothetical protein